MTAAHPIGESHARPLLTIGIPTYNRAEDLGRLLHALQRELVGLEERVSLVITDNASSDHTPEVVARFADCWPRARFMRQAENLGMDGNFCVCAEAVDGEFFWIMGDDDLPVPGAIPKLLALLDQERPDLVYLSSRWLRDINVAAESALTGPLNWSGLSGSAFSRRVHVWTTFLTGMIVRRTAFVDDPQGLRQFSGSHLTQLSWIFERLREGNRFLYVDTPCVLATAGATGGYSVLTVFGDHFPRIVRESFSSSMAQRRMAEDIISRMMLSFLPELIWNLRQAKLGDFQPENVSKALRPQLGSHLFARLILLPIERFPKPLAALVLITAKVLSRFVSLYDRLRTRLSHVS